MRSRHGWQGRLGIVGVKSCCFWCLSRGTWSVSWLQDNDQVEVPTNRIFSGLYVREMLRVGCLWQKEGIPSLCQAVGHAGEIEVSGNLVGLPPQTASDHARCYAMLTHSSIIGPPLSPLPAFLQLQQQQHPLTIRRLPASFCSRTTITLPLPPPH